MTLFDFERRAFAPGDDDEDNDLLVVAEFLNDFQQYFQCGEEPKWQIEVDDLRKTYAYRKILNEIEEAEYNEDVSVRSELLEKVKEFGEVHQALHGLLERFEVWSTKALSQHLLISHWHDRRSKNEATSWSMLLGLPSTSYSLPFCEPLLKSSKIEQEPLHAFAKLWEKVYNTNVQTNLSSDLNCLHETDRIQDDEKSESDASVNSTFSINDKVAPDSDHQAREGHFPMSEPEKVSGLMIPPNEHTWQEYLRIAHMVSLLPNESCRIAAHRSKLCRDERHFRETLNPKFPMTSADLVALWVRAQRNAQAMRHLVQLFKVVKLDDGKGYKAVYEGHHPLLYRRVLKESDAINRLVQWALVNQVLCTQQSVQSKIFEFELQRKRAEPPLSPLHQKRKRMRYNYTQVEGESTLNKSEEKTLLEACQRYILRSVALRHKRPLEVLFFSNAEEAVTAQCCIDVEDLTVALLKRGFSDEIAKLLSGSDFWNLPRIDRGTTMGEFTAKDSEHMNIKHGAKDRFHEIVIELLKATEAVFGTLDMDGADLNGVSIARDFFNSVYMNFWEAKRKSGLLWAAASLLDISMASDQLDANAIMELLMTFPSPWLEMCQKCEETPLGGESFLVCACCGTPTHERCIGTDEHRCKFNVRSFVKSHDPLRDMFAIRLPTGEAPPNYRTGAILGDSVSWETKVITINRQYSEKDGLKPLGLRICPSEVCGKALDDILASGADVSLLFSKIEQPRLALPFEGLAVIGFTAGGMSHLGESSIKTADIITGLEVLEFVSDFQSESKYKAAVVHDFNKIERHDRLRLLKLPALKLRLIVKRPSRDIVSEAKRWLNKAKEQNLEHYKALELSGKLWFCEKCSRTTVPIQPEESEGSRVIREARLCRTVIRMVASNHYELLNISTDDKDERLGVVDVKRLDAMMDWIMYKRSEDPELNSEYSSIEPSPFFNEKVPINWASKQIQSTPFVLLCHGFDKLIKAIQGDPRSISVSISKLLVRFLRLFCAWCLSSDPYSELAFTTCGPPKGAQFFLFPGREQFCASCEVRKVALCRGARFCPKCIHLVQQKNATLQPKTRLDAIAENYRKCSSLVGKTLLFLPSDPFVTNLFAELFKLGVPTEHHDRPVEFLVASYLPRSLGESTELTTSVVSGDFHIIPLMNPIQLKFLLNRCKLRRTPETLDDGNLKEWKTDGILDLEGVMAISYTDLIVKMRESSEILEAISVEVSRQAQCTCSENLCVMMRSGSGCNRSKKEGYDFLPCTNSDCPIRTCEYPFSQGSNCSSPSSHSSLVECILRSRSPFFLEILSPVDDFESNSIRLDNLELSPPFVHCTGLLSRAPEYPNRLVSTISRLQVQGCKILFSDIAFENTQSAVAFCSANPIERPVFLGQPCEIEQVFPITLSEDTIVDGGSPITRRWGFEICVWEGERVLRIGRVLRGSSAARAGLLSGDVINSINGLEVGHATSASFLYYAILSIDNPFRNKKSFDDAITHTLRNAFEIITPLVFSIRRQLNGHRAPHESNSTVSSISSPVDQLFPNQVTHAQHIHPSRMDSTRQNLMFQVDRNGIRFGSSATPGNGTYVPNIRPPQSDTRVFYYSSFASIVASIRGRYSPSEVATERHLYMQGLRNSVLSLLETSVLLGASIRGHIMLGMRMLLPRYEEHFVLNELRNLERRPASELSTVPRLTDELWETLVRFDLKRSESEPDTALRFNDEHYSYRYPVHKLPIDRSLEAIFLRLRPSNPERLRGGGEQIEASRSVYLSDIPRTSWKHILVRGSCKTKDADDDVGDAEIVGIVVSASKTKIGVEVIYISSRGVIEPFNIGEVFDADKLHLVQPSTDDFMNAEEFIKAFKPSVKIRTENFGDIQAVSLIAEEGQSQDTNHSAFDERSDVSSISCIMNNPTVVETDEYQPYPGITEIDSLPTIREKHLSPIIRKGIPTIPEASTGPIDDISMNSDRIVSSKEDTICCTLPLGLLPDNRAVFWLGSDRKALYVSSMNLKFAGCESSLPFVCVWGCTEIANGSRRVLSFKQKDELISHMVADHSYSPGLHNRMFNNTGTLVRIPEGNLIQSLLCDIAATSCLMDSSLIYLTKALPSSSKKYSAGREYFTSLQGNLFMFDEEHQSFSTTLDTGQRDFQNSKAYDLFLLSSRIGRLFDSDGYHKYQEGNLILPRFQEDSSQTYRQASPDICKLCNIRSEHVLQCDADVAGPRGLGCSTLSKECFGLKSGPEDGRSLANQILLAKRILLALAPKVPKFVPSTESNRQFSEYLWKGDSLDNWAKLVQESRSWKTLTQAYAVLVGSIEYSKMPKWWKSEGQGWGMVQSIMSIQSISALLMHLFIFDGAVTEYVTQIISDTSSLPKADLPSIYKGLTYLQISTRVLQVAQSKGISSFDGENGEYCCICREGGELLCCELCANVQHAYCVTPKLAPGWSPDKFVCNACIADIAYLQKYGV